jgi:hypothetical protein
MDDKYANISSEPCLDRDRITRLHTWTLIIGLDHSQDVTPKIGEEFQEELRPLFFNLVVSYWISRF